jgi:hypothetical protein
MENLLDHVDLALEYVIGAIQSGYQLSEEQTRKLRGVLPEPITTSSSDKEEVDPRAEIWKRLNAVYEGVGISANRREESIKKLRKKIDSIAALEADLVAIRLLSINVIDASDELHQAKVKLNLVSARLEAGETFSTAPPIRSANQHLKRLMDNLWSTDCP